MDVAHSSFICSGFLFDRLSTLNSLDILVADGMVNAPVPKGRGAPIET